MIDARDYETREELEEAMKFESNVEKVKYLTEKIACIEFKMESTISHYEYLLTILNQKKTACEKEIDAYWRKVHEDGTKPNHSDSDYEKRYVFGRG